MDDQINRVMVLGLDGGTLEVFRPFAKKGIMPQMNRILADGAVGPLQSVIPPATGPAWASFMTGKQPGKHGIFDFVMRSQDQLTRRPVNYNDIQTSTLLSIVGNLKNKSVCSFNLPITYPPQQINGVVVTGMLTPDLEAQYTYPSALKSQFESKYGPYLLDIFWQRFSDNTAVNFLQQLLEYEKQKFAIAKDLLSEKKWDLYMAVITGTDRIQHALWHIIESIIDDTTLRPREEKLKPLVIDYYEFLDEYITEMIGIAGEETTVIFMSDHGFGPLKKKFFINYWLYQMGLLKYDINRIRKNSRRLQFKKLVKKSLFKLPLLPGLITSAGIKSIDRRMGVYHFLDQIEWSKTKAYSSSGTEQGIYLNLIGREPYGIIQPGKEYEDTRNQIIASLKNLEDQSDRKPLVSHIYKREEIYHGPLSDSAPDIVFFLKNGNYLADIRLTDHLWGDVSWLTGRGTHRIDGIFIAYGNGIRNNLNVEASIVDIAPTILFLLDLPIPEDMDGKVLMNLFHDDFVQSRQPRFESQVEKAKKRDQSSSLSEKDEEKIFKRLRDLGYI